MKTDAGPRPQDGDTGAMRPQPLQRDTKISSHHWGLEESGRIQPPSHGSGACQQLGCSPHIQHCEGTRSLVSRHLCVVLGYSSPRRLSPPHRCSQILPRRPPYLPATPATTCTGSTHHSPEGLGGWRSHVWDIHRDRGTTVKAPFCFHPVI